MSGVFSRELAVMTDCDSADLLSAADPSSALI
jgi:hypothetical protein